MFRYATVSSINCCRNLSTSAISAQIIKLYKPKLLKPSFNYLLLARDESTSGINNSGWSKGVVVSDLSTGAGIERETVTASINTQHDPSLLSVTDATSQCAGSGSNPESIFDAESSVSDTFSEQFQFTPESPEIPAQILENVIMPVAANGEPTLASMGLGGWWPPGIFQQYLEYLHCDLGLPWWGAIVTGSIVVHLFLFALVIKIQRQVAKMNNNMPQMEHNHLNNLKQIAVPLAVATAPTAPIFLGCFFGLQAMANLPVESMKTGGLLWFTDLTIADPFYVLPLITCATVFVTLETGALGARLSSSTGGNLIKYAFSIVGFPVFMDFPAALLCNLITMNTVALAVGKLLRIPAVRKKFNLDLEVFRRPVPEDLPMTRKGFKQSFKDSWASMKKAKEMEESKRAERAPIPKTYRYDPTKSSPSPTQAKRKQT